MISMSSKLNIKIFIIKIDLQTYVTYTHMETKELTAEDQYNWVNRIN